MRDYCCKPERPLLDITGKYDIRAAGVRNIYYFDLALSIPP
jgi:hypothetical protein